MTMAMKDHYHDDYDADDDDVLSVTSICSSLSKADNDDHKTTK